MTNGGAAVNEATMNHPASSRRGDGRLSGRPPQTVPAFPRGDTARAAGRSRAGFTLIEMMAVVLIIALVCAIAIPQLLPAIAVSQFEGAARHLAGYGRAAISRAILIGEPLTVSFDLDKQEYWAVRQVAAEDDFFEEEEEKEGEQAEETAKRQQQARNQLFGGDEGDGAPSMDLLNPASLEGEPRDPARDPNRRRFEQFVRLQLEARASRCEKEGILSEIGPLFDKPFSLEREEDQYQEVMEPLLERSQMPEGVRIDSVKIGSTTHSSGTAEVELTSLGLMEAVVIYVEGEDGDYYTVVWDPITSNAQIEPGRKEFESNWSAPKRDKAPAKRVTRPKRIR